MGWMSDESGLGKCRANYTALTPLSHLARAARVFPEREALVYGTTRRTYSEYHARVSRLASALEARGVRPGDVVATLLLNTAPHCEAHFGVPACGAVLNAINVRLDVGTVAYIFEHGEARVVLADTAFIPLAEKALEAMPAGVARPELIEVPDSEAGLEATGRHLTYEALLEDGSEDAPWIMPEDEWESISLNYTSGTTGRPKGVVYHHRGAYLSTMGQVISWRLQMQPRYLTIVPLFHCNNWCHVWMIPALGGTVVCNRDVTAKAIYDAVADEGVTHFGGAPIVLGLLVNAPEAERRSFDHTVEVFTAGAPPAAAILAAIEPLGFNITQVYGLTETYGPITECLWDSARWDGLAQKERAAIKARTGVLMPTAEEVTVVDDYCAQSPMDAETPGEVVMRGNMVMKGYLKNPEASEHAFRGGYFHSEDIAIQHPDGYIQITDRAKDIIISGGENVSSVEVEGVLMHHPAVALCAVVAKPDEKWGEVPCAFVELKPGAEVSEAELIAHCRGELAGFKTPKHVVFHELPKTPTGKIQKFELRRHAKEWDPLEN